MNTMPLSGENRKTLVLLLAAWPVVVAMGWVLGQASGTSWPTAALAVGWLMVLFGFLSRATGSDD